MAFCIFLLTYQGCGHLLVLSIGLRMLTGNPPLSNTFCFIMKSNNVVVGAGDYYFSLNFY